MTTPRLTGYQYLESLDSVRTPWLASTAVGSAEEEQRRELHELEVLLEVLLTLALGRDIVVPQSYAFDSWSFLRVAKTVFRARDLAGSAAKDEHPFRLHLYNASTYNDAVTRMLTRVHDRENPFVSSLLPELRTLPAGQVAGITRLEQLCQSGWIGDERAQALKCVERNFQNLPRVPARPRPGQARLAELLNHFVDDSAQTAHWFSGQAKEVHEDLTGAIRRLDPRRSGLLSQRSLLRALEPWPADPERRTPEEIIGRERLDLVIEFVDTLYNMIVADSIGIAPVTFSTELTLGNERLHARGIAQKLAWAGYAAATEGLTVSIPQGKEGSVFEAWTGDGPSPGEEVKELRSHVEEGLAALFQQRACRGERGGARSDFWNGLDKLNAALDSEDVVAAERALAAHVKCVSRILGRGADVVPASSGGGGGASTWWMRLVHKGTWGGAGVGLTTMVQMPIVPAILTAGLLTIAPELAEGGRAVTQRGRRFAMHRKALGTVLEVRGSTSRGTTA